MNFEICHYSVTKSDNEEDQDLTGSSSASPERRQRKEVTPAQLEYRNALKEELFVKPRRRLLSFGEEPSLSEDRSVSSPLRVLQPHGSASRGIRKARKIPNTPERILDAPDLADDYYSNILDWSKHDVLAVALGARVFLWHAPTCRIEQLMEVDEDDTIASLSYSKDGGHLAIGTGRGIVQVWDVERMKQLRALMGHSARVGSLAWNGFQPLLSSGSRDASIMHHDVRVADHLVATLEAHTQEVCGLQWSSNGLQLASGGNDNLVCIWDAAVSSRGALHRLTQHKAAVKAIAWAPFESHLLASGGGTACRHIRFWNTQTGHCISAFDTHAQVCALQWSRHCKELVSSHGFAMNQLCVWSYPSMTKLAELSGHASRPLHLTQNPQGTTVASAAADETLRFWKIWDPPQEKETSRTCSIASPRISGGRRKSSLGRIDIR